MQLKIVGEAVVDTEERPSFDTFWLLYPKKVAKFDAQRAWNKLGEPDRLAAITGLVAWRQVWLRGDLQFAPHAATFLNGHRWEDELPQNWGNRHSSHVPFEPESPAVKSEMPAHVKLAIAKLRGK